MVSVVGRLGNQPTVLSKVQIFDFETGKMRWIDEVQLVHIIGKIGVNNVHGVDLAKYELIPVYEIRNGRKAVCEKYKGKELAIAYVEVKHSNTIGFIVKTARNIKFVKYGQPLELARNIMNLGINDIYNSGLINEWSITHPYNILPKLESIPAYIKIR